MGLMLALKENFHRSKMLSIFLMNIFEIELLILLVTSKSHGLIGKIFQFTFPNYDESQKFQRSQQEGVSPGSVILLVINVVLMGVVILGCSKPIKNSKHVKKLLNIAIKIIKMFKYIGLVPLTILQIQGLRGGILGCKIISVINIIFLIVWSQLNQSVNWSYRFIEWDYCNMRHSRQVPFLLAIGFLVGRLFISPIYVSLIYFFRALVRLMIVIQHYDYRLIQKTQLFYSLLGIYLFIVLLGEELWEFQLLNEPVCLATIIGFGVLICYSFVDKILWKLNQHRLQNSSQLNLHDQIESQTQNISHTIEQNENVLRILTDVYLQHNKFLSQQQNNFTYYWQIYQRLIMVHRIQCAQVKCPCKKSKLQDKESKNLMQSKQELQKLSVNDQSTIFLLQLLNLTQNLCQFNTKQEFPKILYIYMLVEITKKPLKAYYELIKLKQEKTIIDRQTIVQLDFLTKETRQCFAQVFTKNKAKNQQLQLIKVIQYQQLMISLENKLYELLNDLIAFHQMFLFHTIKAQKIKQESKMINQKKEEIQKQFQNILTNFADSPKFEMMVLIFYKFVQIYRSKQNDIKKLASQQILKKRLFQKNQTNIFQPQYGSIYIDLVQQRGKIMNLTSNICSVYGYNRDQMVGFNIKRFMPSIFSKHHDKFLSNFVERGKIRLLRSKERVIFGKNKKKFIFPINVRLKAQYLLENQFGSTSLINGVDTSSQFMLVGLNGKLQQITEGLYRRLFGNIFKEQVGRCSRLSVYKLLPSLNNIHNSSEELSPNKIYEGLLLTTTNQQYLGQKFRYARQIISNASTTNGVTSSGTQQVSSVSQVSLIFSQTNTSIGLNQQNQITDFLTQTFKAFLVDLNIWKIKGFKVNYKLSNILTSQFKLILLEIVSIEPLQNITFWRMLIEELKIVASIYQLDDEHGPIMMHLNQIEQTLNSTQFQQLQLSSNPFLRLLQNDLLPSSQYGQVRRKRQSYSRQIQAKQQSSTGSSDSFIPPNKIQQDYQHYQMSQQSSLRSSTSNQSKRQLIISVFNSSQNIISQKLFCFLNLIILIIMAILTLSAVFTIKLVKNDVNLWNDIKILYSVEQSITWWTAIDEVQTFIENWQGSHIGWGQMLKNKSVGMLKSDLQEISKRSESPKQFYIKLINLQTRSKNTDTVSLVQLIQRYSYMMSYGSQQNIDQMKYYRFETKKVLTALKIQRLKSLNQIQEQNYFRIVIMLAVYQFLLIILHVSIFVIYLFYRREEERILSLLSFVNPREVKKSISKLKNVKMIMKNLQTHSLTSIHLLAAEDTFIKTNPIESQNDSSAPSKSLKISLQNSHSNSGHPFEKTKLIFILLVSFIFLSNFTISSFLMMETSQKYFMANIQAANLVYTFQIQVPNVLSSSLGKVNQMFKQNGSINFIQQDNFGSNIFDVQKELQKPKYDLSPIKKLTGQFFPSPICSVIKCQDPSTQSSQISFQYMVFVFYKKFGILLSEDGVILGQNVLNQWIDASYIQTVILCLEEIINFSSLINAQIDNYFSLKSQQLELILIICGVSMIPLNILIIFLAQKKFSTHLYKILRQTEELFMHFNVNLLSENTYLMSYFNSKIKYNK